jgi:hypothetical protein
VDTTRDIIYRNFVLNDEDIDDSIVGGGGLDSGVAGCVVDSVDFSDVDVVQFMEKRSQSDGMDAGPVEFGSRRIRMNGTLYGKSRGDLFDRWRYMRTALNAVLAQRESPADLGYRPLYFSLPTLLTDEADYPGGVIPLQMRAMPRALQSLIGRDNQGGEDPDPLAIPWQATFICKDPAILGETPVEINFSATSEVTGTTGTASTDLFTKTSHGLVAGDRITFSALTGGTGLVTGTAYYIIATSLTANDFKVSALPGGTAVNFTTNVTASTWVKSSAVSGNWRNRGTYMAPLNMLIEVGAGAGSILFSVGDSVGTITLPASSVNRIIRFKQDKVLTVEENDNEQPQMSYITWTGDSTWPLIDPGDTPYTFTFHGLSGVQSGSLAWFYEQHA